ncbi:hypothetical protein DL769_010896 [Monosporascus sp. CRB-8-3]|nr:hypothetical protein DL769_010896 [Monosporascus sp. CRB-8-3]
MDNSTGSNVGSNAANHADGRVRYSYNSDIPVLAHLNLKVMHRSGKEAERLLCDFMRDKPRGVIADYDYKSFRTWLKERLEIPPEDTLGMSNRDHANLLIKDDQSFWLTLACIESGKLRTSRNIPWGVPQLDLIYPPEVDLVHPADDPQTEQTRARSSVPAEVETPPPRNISHSSARSNGRSVTRSDSGEFNPDSVIGASTPPRIERPGTSAGSAIVISSEDTPEAPEDPGEAGGGTDDQVEGVGDEEEDEGTEGNASSVDNHPVLEEMDDVFPEVSDSNPTWAQVCKFFGCPLDAEEYRLPYLEVPLRHYQLFAAWSMLTQHPRNGISSVMLGDEPGLGKTAEVICVLATFRYMHQAWEEVQEEWERKNLPMGRRKHLAKDDQADDAECPSQGRSKYGFQCPCVKAGYPHRIVREIENYPCIITCVPEGIDHWLKELDKFLGQSSEISVTVYHNDWRKVKGIRHDQAAMIRTRALAGEHVIFEGGDGPGLPGCLIKPPRNGSRNIIIVSQLMARKLVQLYDDNTRTWNGPFKGDVANRARGRTFRQNMLAASWVVFDECQHYHGGRNSVTTPFRALQDLTQTNWSHARRDQGTTMAIGITADFLVTGPPLWRPFIRHAEECNGTKELKLGPIKKLADLDEFENYWDYVVRYRHDENRRDAVNQRTEGLRELFRTFVPKTIIARRYDTKWFGKPILDVPVEIQDRRHDSSGTGAAHEAMSTLCARVRAWADMEFNEQLGQFQMGRRADEPDREEEQRKALLRAAQGNAGGNMPRAFVALQRSTTYPTLARLWVERVVADGEFAATAINMLASRVTDMIYGHSEVDREAVLAILRESPFWGYIDELRSNSPKYQALCGYIDEMTGLNGEDTAPPQGPPDGSGIRHMLAFHNTITSAFITFMLLYVDYPSLDFIFIHAGLSPKERGELASYVQQDCTTECRNKVVVSTYRLFGSGFNLFRANYCILLDQPRTKAIQEQAFRRVARGGQQQKTRLIQLYDGRNLPEAILRLQSTNRAELSGMGYAGAMINWDDFIIAEGKGKEKATATATASGSGSGSR